jgi:hypothetical protein
MSARAVEIGGLICKSIAALITNHKAGPQQSRLASTPRSVRIVWRHHR